MKIEGEVAPGFEPVERLFISNMTRLAETCAQLCVYVNEDRVVDLWAAPDGTPFSPDSLVNVFSSGKSLEAIALASLFDKGLLRYDERITHYWPEFGGAGKEATTAADLMRHEAGLAGFNVSLHPGDLLPDRIRENAIGRVIETHPQAFRAEHIRREYHALTRGWIANELFRRVDPQGRTIGEYLKQDIRGPLGVDVHVGLGEDELERRSPVIPIRPGRHLKDSLKPAFLGRKVQHSFFGLAANLLPAVSRMRTSTTRDAPAPFVGWDMFDFFNRPEVAMGETPSANAHASARGLAQLAAVMANQGRWGEGQVVSGEAWTAMHDNPKREDMGLATNFTQGGVAHFGETSASPSRLEVSLNRGREGFYGWMGLGGSIFQWHPEKRIGFAFVPTRLHILDLVNERGKAYQRQVLDCVDA